MLEFVDTISRFEAWLGISTHQADFDGRFNTLFEEIRPKPASQMKRLVGRQWFEYEECLEPPQPSRNV
jgi:hypothetical protein